jgi:hypothetical protein
MQRVQYRGRIAELRKGTFGAPDRLEVALEAERWRRIA